MFRAKQDLETFIRGDIEVRYSPVHGRGVFATADIPPNVCIEICPAIVFGAHLLNDWRERMQTSLGGRHILTDHIFGRRDQDGGHAIVFGYGSIYNHKIDNNAHFRWSKTMKEPAMEFWSKTAIKKDEEIFVKYCRYEEDEWYWLD